MIDSHCHLADKTTFPDIDAVLSTAAENGVHTVLTIGCAQADWLAVQQMAVKYASVFGALGIHPEEIENTPDFQRELEQALSAPKIIGVGETGLDFYYSPDTKSAQERGFRQHLELCAELNKPVVVHTREAEKETVAVLQQAYKERPFSGVIHCFSGSAYLASAALELGLYISVSGIITFKKSLELQQVVKNIPLNKLLVETDAPYLAPTPFRGKRNEPVFVVKTAEKLAELKECPLQQVEEITTKNFKELFKIG